MRKISISRLICLVAFALVIAPRPGRGDQLTEHLTGRVINAILYDDKRGVIWIATADKGLIKFDGATFTPCPAFGQGPSCAAIKALALDGDGNLWIGTSANGASRLRFKDNVWETYDTRNGLLNNEVLSLAIDNENVWFGTADGVGLFDNKNKNWFGYTTTVPLQWNPAKMGWDTLKTCYRTAKRLSDKSVLAIAVDHAKKIWCGTETGISVLIDKCEWDNKSIGIKPVLSVWVDPQNRKWFGATDGVYRLAADDANAEPQLLPSPPYPSYLRNRRILAIAPDYDGNLWFGMSPGVASLDTLSMVGRRFTGYVEIDEKRINCITADDDGNLWFGTNLGLLKYAANWVSFSAANDDSLKKMGGGPTINAMALDQLGQIWIGTQRGLARYDGKDWKIPTYLGVYAIAVAKDTTLWLGVAGGQVIQIRPDGSIKKTIKVQTAIVFSIALAGDSLWVGTNGGGLLLYNSMTKELLKTFRKDDPAGGPISDQIDDLALDWRGRLWCGTQHGVSCYDGKAWRSFTTADGLVDTLVNSITIDREKRLVWFATQGGAANINENDQWRRLTVDDGLIDNNVNDIEIFAERGEIWFATVNGVSCRNAAGEWVAYTKRDGLADNFVTTIQPGSKTNDIWLGTQRNGVTRYRRPIKAPNTQILTEFDVVTQSELIYRFLGNDLNTSKGLLRYSYKLAPEDTAWSPYTFDNFARVKATQNGLHAFYVKAIDKDKHESRPATDFFYKIAPEIGSYTSRTDTIRINNNKLDSVQITLYWPPYQLADTMKVTIVPVHPDFLNNDSAILAYDFTPYQTDIRKKGVILTFEFPAALATPNQTYSIQRDLDGNGQANFAALNGTPASDRGRVRITTRIDQFGRYAVRVKDSAADPSGALAVAKVNAQPRIFSPRGGGHGSSTTLFFQLPKDAHVRVKIYNLGGRLVDTVWDEPMQAGVNAVAWDGRDYNHRICPTGLYIMSIESNVLNSQAKVMVLNE